MNPFGVKLQEMSDSETPTAGLSTDFTVVCRPAAFPYTFAHLAPGYPRMSNSAIRVLIADDHEIVRMGVRLLLETRHWTVCGEASNGREAIAKAQELAPDVVVLDLTMPVMNGYDAAPQIRAIAPGAKIVFFTMHDIPVTAKQAGADAFVVKSRGPYDLVAAIERVTGSGQGAADKRN